MVESNPIPGLFKKAMRAHHRGEADFARAYYNKILKLNDALPEVHFQLGRLELGQGAPALALKHLRKARSLKPSEPVIWQLMMDALISMKDQAGIRKLLIAAKKKNLPKALLKDLTQRANSGGSSSSAKLGTLPPQEFTAVVQLFESRKLKEAVAAAQTLVKKHPNVAPLHAVLGASLAALGELEEAEAEYTTATVLDPSYGEGFLQLGQLQFEMNNQDGAKKSLSKALELLPESPLANRYFGLLGHQMKAYKTVLPILEKALQLLPDDTVVRRALADCYVNLKRYQDAKESIEPNTKIEGAKFADYRMLGDILMEFDQTDEALENFHKAYDMSPNNTDSNSMLAQIYGQIGKFEIAAEYAEKVFAGGDLNGTLFGNYARTRKLSPDDDLVQTMETAFEKGEESEGTRTALAFALAKIHEDAKNSGKAFKYIAEGNNTLKSEFPIDTSIIWGGFETAKSFTEKGIKAAKAPAPASSPKSLFVTGMPRSGTTLTEQILGSHSLVEAGGELGLLTEHMQSSLNLLRVEGKDLTEGHLQEQGAKITQRLKELHPNASYVTDKGIFAFNYVGLAQKALPDSHMVVVRRDPRDNCLSMYKNLFVQGTHTYTTDLEVLGQTYIKYLEVLDYWRAKVPGTFTEIYYEDLISNPEEEARKLVDACGLEWEDSCLEFYKNSSKVKTLSVYQVRQPIYSSSVGAWKKFEDELQPLLNILEKGGAIEAFEQRR